MAASTLPRSRKPDLFFSRGVFLVLLLLAAGSTFVGVRNALRESKDFQWSAVRLLDRQIDPYATYLSGDPGHQLILSQVPNYLPVLYVLMSPLGLLPAHRANEVWALCNTVFAIACALLTARLYGLRGRGQWTVMGLFLASTATRMAIGNGQQSLPILLIWCLTLRGTKMPVSRAGLCGISYAKFSFAPPVFFFLLFRQGFGAGAFSFVPVFAGAALAWFWLGLGHSTGSLAGFLKEPLDVAHTGYSTIGADHTLVNVVRPLLTRWPEQAELLIGLLIGLCLCLAVSYFAFHVHRGSSVQWQLALMAIMSYALFNHHAYDAVVLLFPLCYALKLRRRRAAHVVLALIAYLFYVQRVVEAVHLHRDWMRVVEFGMLMAILALTYSLREPVDRLTMAVEAEELTAPEREQALAG